MADDLNTPAAIGALFDAVRVARAAPAGADGRRTAAGAVCLLRRCAGQILGILTEEATAGRVAPAAGVDAHVTEALIEFLIELRHEARAARDWARADRIRERLAELGIRLEDGAEKTTWRTAWEGERAP